MYLIIKMRYHLLLLSVILFAYSCRTQSHSKTMGKQEQEYIQQTKEFIQYIRTIEYPKDTILLVDKPNMKELNKCIPELLFDTTLFTIIERGIIRSQVSMPFLNNWETILVDKARIISQDTVNAIFKDKYRWWNYFYKHYGKGFSSYSAPIFLRNYTLCLFYSGHSCGGLCGGGQVTLFKKEHNTWKPFRIFCNWIS